jgi:hypothetical protein
VFVKRMGLMGLDMCIVVMYRRLAFCEIPILLIEHLIQAYCTFYSNFCSSVEFLPFFH